MHIWGVTVKDEKAIGVLGLGLVGTALAEILLERGFRVHVWNRSPEKAHTLSSAGARAEESPAAVGEACERVLISVMTTEIVAELCERTRGLLAAARPPRYVLDTTTGDPVATAPNVEDKLCDQLVWRVAAIASLRGHFGLR
jgi:3-hydroxyisobutyrate dehydrogenase